MTHMHACIRICMNTYTHIYIFTGIIFINIRTHMYVQAFYTYTQMFTCICMYKHSYRHTHLHVCIQAFYTHMHTYKQVFIYVHTYICHTHTLTYVWNTPVHIYMHTHIYELWNYVFLYRPQ